MASPASSDRYEESGGQSVIGLEDARFCANGLKIGTLGRDGMDAGNANVYAGGHADKKIIGHLWHASFPLCYMSG